MELRLGNTPSTCKVAVVIPTLSHLDNKANEAVLALLEKEGFFARTLGYGGVLHHFESDASVDTARIKGLLTTVLPRGTAFSIHTQNYSGHGNPYVCEAITA